MSWASANLETEMITVEAYIASLKDSDRLIQDLAPPIKYTIMLAK